MKTLLKRISSVVFLWVAPLAGLHLFPEYKTATFILIVLAGYMSYATIIGDDLNEINKAKSEAQSQKK